MQRVGNPDLVARCFDGAQRLQDGQGLLVLDGGQRPDGARPDVGIGVELDLGRGGSDALGACELLFCENGGYVLEVATGDLVRVAEVLDGRGAWHAVVGRTTDETGLIVRGDGIGEIALSEDEMNDAWLNGATEVML